MSYIGSGKCEECKKPRKRLASTFWGIFCEECLRGIRKDLAYGLFEIQQARKAEKEENQ